MDEALWHRRIPTCRCGFRWTGRRLSRRSTSALPSGITPCVILLRKRSGSAWRCLSSVVRGWSEAGGPWVTPEMAMKKLVWSETEITGPLKYSEMLAAAAVERRPCPGFDCRITSGRASLLRRLCCRRLPHARDEAVPMASLHPKITTSNGPIDGTALLDGSLTTSRHNTGAERWLSRVVAV